MLKGKFSNPYGRPLLKAYLKIPQVGAEGMIEFQVDTGADVTTLSHFDSVRLGISHASITKRHETTGAGGSSNDYEIEALLTVSDGEAQTDHTYKIDLIIQDPKTDKDFLLPSLLGLNIINKWSTTFCYLEKTMTAKVLKSDIQQPITGLPVTRTKAGLPVPRPKPLA
jgi:hypothetical protein